MAHEDAIRNSSDSDGNTVPQHTNDGSITHSSKAVAFRRGSEESRSSSIIHSMDGVKGNNEFSPLLEPQREGEVPRFASVVSPEADRNWEDLEPEGEETKSSWYLFLLTIAIGG